MCTLGDFTTTAFIHSKIPGKYTFAMRPKKLINAIMLMPSINAFTPATFWNGLINKLNILPGSEDFLSSAEDNNF